MRVRARTPAQRRKAKNTSLSHRTQKPNLSPSPNSPVNNILYLQRTIGNRAVQRLIKSRALQAKLGISQPNDMYEQEADRIANEMMNMPRSASSSPSESRVTVERSYPKHSKVLNRYKFFPEAFAVKKPSTYTLFPFFTGKEMDAYEEIGRQLGKDPRDSDVTLALLGNIKVTKPKLKASFDSVLKQLRLELHLKNHAKEFFNQIKSFVTNLAVSYHIRLHAVGDLLKLKDDDVMSIFVTRVISEGFEAIGEIKSPIAKFVAEALKVIWDTYNQAKSARQANKVSLAFVNQLLKLDEAFNQAITNVELMQKNSLDDWSLLQKVGEMKWPTVTGKLRKQFGVEFEKQVWKELLPTKWKHMTASDDPTFHKTINWIDKYLQKNPQYYITYKPGQKGLIWIDKGYWVTMHWLGSGSHPLFHSTANREIALRLFNVLNIPRKEVFEQWSLPRQTLVISHMHGR
jgi:hypothetical protein